MRISLVVSQSVSNGNEESWKDVRTYFRHLTGLQDGHLKGGYAGSTPLKSSEGPYWMNMADRFLLSLFAESMASCLTVNLFLLLVEFILSLESRLFQRLF